MELTERRRRPKSKRIVKAEAEATETLMGIIERGLDAGPEVYEYERRDDGTFSVDVCAEGVCYIGPFVVTVRLRPQPAERA